MNDFGRQIIANIPHLRRYARSLVGDINLADDIVQDCLERAWSKQHLWGKRGDLRPWLFTILHNVHVNAARAFNRAPTQVPIDSNLTQHSNDEAEADLYLQDLQQSLARLPENQRQVIFLVGVEQFSYEETAEILSVPVGTVMSRLSRARSKLREEMNRSQGISLRSVK